MNTSKTPKQANRASKASARGMASQELPLSQVLSQDDFVSDSDSSSSSATKNGAAREHRRRKNKTSSYDDSDYETRLSDSADGVVKEDEEANRVRSSEEVGVVDFRVRDPAVGLLEDEEEGAKEEIARESLCSTEETLSEVSVAELQETETPKVLPIVSGAVSDDAVTQADDSGVPEGTPVVNKSEQVGAIATSASPAAAAAVDSLTLEPLSGPPATTTSSNDEEQVVDRHSSPHREDTTAQPDDSLKFEDIPARTSEQLDAVVTSASEEHVNELKSPTSNQTADGGSVPTPAEISPSSKNHQEQAADATTRPANNGDAAVRSSDVPMDTAIVKSEQVNPAAVQTSANAVAELPMVVTNENNGARDVPPSNLKPSDTTVPAQSSDPLIVATSTSTTNNRDPEPVVEAPSQPLPQQEPPRTLKRYAEMNNVQLKKQKLVLENLKLALELGVITREECVAKGRLLVTQTST